MRRMRIYTRAVNTTVRIKNNLLPCIMKLKTLIISAFIVGAGFSTEAQTDIQLNLNHHFNLVPFSFGATYDLNGTAVSVSRVNYYLSGFELTYDGGQTMALPNTYLLATANVTDYLIGQENITTVEGIQFDLGLDSAANHLGTSNWPVHHPLASQSPSMDWNWPAGYFFFTIDGMIDNTGDGIPNQPFQTHGLGDHLLRDVNGFSGMNCTGSPINIPMYVNVADWLLNNDLDLIGFAHDGSAVNITVADNTNDETVFTLNEPLGQNELEDTKSHIFADYTVAYAPTIYYDLNTLEEVDIKVIDMGGRVVLEDAGQNHEGNYFIRKELQSGSYMIVFSNDGISESFRFVVSK